MKLRKFITRRRLKWAGTIVFSLMLTMFVLSAWYMFRVVHVEPGAVEPNGTKVVVLAKGSLILWIGVSDPDAGGFGAFEYVAKAIPDPGLNLGWRWIKWDSGIGGKMNLEVWIPLWAPLLLIALPTAYLWYKDRRPKPWQCRKCRYDLRGLEGEGDGSGDGAVCPECGLAKGEV